MSESDKVDAAPVERLRESRQHPVVAEVALEETHAGDRLHVEEVEGDDSRACRPSLSRSTCVQLPGAAPRSTTLRPGRSSWSLLVDLDQLERGARAVAAPAPPSPRGR